MEIFEILDDFAIVQDPGKNRNKGSREFILFELDRDDKKLFIKQCKRSSNISLKTDLYNLSGEGAKGINQLNFIMMADLRNDCDQYSFVGNGAGYSIEEIGELSEFIKAIGIDGYGKDVSIYGGISFGALMGFFYTIFSANEINSWLFLGVFLSLAVLKVASDKVKDILGQFFIPLALTVKKLGGIQNVEKIKTAAEIKGYHTPIVFTNNIEIMKGTIEWILSEYQKSKKKRR